MISEDSLCLQCGNACTKGCSWARDFVPVDGWTAIPTHRKRDDSYLVISCPEYKEDEPIKNIDKYGMMRLLEAMSTAINEDYIDGTPAMRRVIEKDLRQGPARHLLQLNDTDAVIRKLRRIAKQRDNEKEERVQP